MRQSQKVKIVKEIRQRMETWYSKQNPRERGPLGDYCPYWAFYTFHVLKKHNFDVHIQAGTAYWARLTPEQDDGRPETCPQFGYEFTEDPLHLQKLLLGHLPEMHAWVVIANDPPVIVDVTTCFWIEQAKRIGGFDWLGPLPPSFFWGTEKDLPQGTLYHAHRQAISLINLAMRSSILI